MQFLTSATFHYLIRPLIMASIVALLLIVSIVGLLFGWLIHYHVFGLWFGVGMGALFMGLWWKAPPGDNLGGGPTTTLTPTVTTTVGT